MMKKRMGKTMSTLFKNNDNLKIIGAESNLSKLRK